MNLIAKGNVKHDGKWFAEGDKISRLKKEDGQRLIVLGVAYESGEEDTDTETGSPLTSVPDGTDTNFVTPPADIDEDDEDEEDEEDDEEEEEETPAPKRQRNRKK